MMPSLFFVATGATEGILGQEVDDDKRFPATVLMGLPV
jgi:hypothetical protein